MHIANLKGLEKDYSILTIIPNTIYINRNEKWQ
jgi:hypothetical protein